MKKAKYKLNQTVKTTVSLLSESREILPAGSSATIIELGPIRSWRVPHLYKILTLAGVFFVQEQDIESEGE